MQHLSHLSNEDLLVSFRARVRNANINEASIVVHLIEIEERRIDRDSACSSMWSYCVEREGFSESQAYTRLAAADVVRAFPLALEYLERGDIHLCGFVELRRVLTAGNHEELLREASGKSIRALRELIAARHPKPDVPSRIEPVAPQALRPKLEPLSATRYRLEATISSELNDIVEDIKNLMASQPDARCRDDPRRRVPRSPREVAKGVPREDVAAEEAEGEHAEEEHQARLHPAARAARGLRA